MSFGGPTLYQYAADVAGTLLAASRTSLAGRHVFNLPGVVADGRALAAAIEAVVPGAAGLIDFEPGDLPFPSEIDHDGIEAVDPAPVTPLLDGIAETVDIYAGWPPTGGSAGRPWAGADRLDPLNGRGLDARVRRRRGPARGPR